MMALMVGALAGRAQTGNPTTLQTFQFKGYDYPSDPGGAGALIDIWNNFTVTIGTTSAFGTDYYNNTGAMEGSGGSMPVNNGILNFSFPFTNNYTANVILNTSSDYCTQCDGRAGNPEGSSNSVNNPGSWYFGNDPLGQLITLDNSEFHTQYRIRIPAPKLNTSGGTGSNCASNVTLSAVINWPNLNGLTYSFEYQTGSGSFQVFAVTANPVISVSDYSTLVNFLNSSSTTSVGFRVRVIAGNDTSQYGGNSVSFSPPPPKVGSFLPTDACGGGALGTIQLNNITGLGNYLYVLQPTSPCDPTIPGSCTSGRSGPLNGSSPLITDIPAGSYNLLVVNNGGAAGACSQTIPITINGYAALTASGVHTDVSCPGGSDGSITVTTTGGKPGTITFQLVNLSTGATPPPPQSSGTFTGLPAGNYQVNVWNGCGTGSNPTFLLTQPTAVTGSYTQSNATCSSPGDGSLKATVDQGSGTYNYFLYLNGSLVASQSGSFFTNWEVDGLAPGVYNLQVLDAARPTCAGYAATVTIGGPPALGLTVLQQTDVSCYGMSTGSISLLGSGGMNIYSYTITNPTTGASYSNTTGVFTDLAAGSYTAVVQSAVSGCGDQYIYPQPVVVSQPADLSIGLSPTDVRCYGEGNGSIGATTGGGTGVLALTWEMQVSGVWTATGGSGVTLNNLLPGSYRLSVTDANSCNKVSSVVTIAQPDTLVIPSVGLTDIICYGGNGTITPIATGGNGGNVFAFSADAGSNYAAFLPGSAFGAGSYQVRVTDSKGCTAGYRLSQVITAPPSPLVFSDQLSDYHGFNVSCYGATTGIVTASASGGNGSSYNNYSYSVDGGTYQTSPVLNNLPAGAHVIRVEDGRGCIVQQTETLTQPASDMAVGLLNKKDNDCADGIAGLLSVSVSGGTAPYQFSKDGITYQNDGNFAELASGDYTITAMDVNGCRLGSDYVIQSLYPAMTVSHSVGAVQCNGGSDGSIQLDVSGGFGGYTYQWSTGGNSNEATGLRAGTYTVHITDEKGCGAGDTAAVGQPLPLAAQLIVRPLCSDATGGRVKATASGGTPPYLYASDGGSANTDSAFNELSAGQHTLWITDSHGCNWSQAVTIAVNPLVPVVNFLVSTQQNVLDTLQAEDISSPKPDSVQWTFDPATLLLGSSPEGPLIRYTKPGTYPASMRAWYGGCDFSISQNILIQPYDTNSRSPMVLAGMSIDTARLSPNPTSGTFNVYVKLYKAQRLVLTVMSLSGQPVYRKQWDSQQLVSEPVSLPSSVVSGAYIVELVTETEIRDYNIIVAK